MIKYYALTAILYCFYAYVPYLGLSYKYSIGVCALMSLIGGLLWGIIQANTPLSNISTAGLMFDAIITISFFTVPILIYTQSIDKFQATGAALIFVGICFIKHNEILKQADLIYKKLS